MAARIGLAQPFKTEPCMKCTRVNGACSLRCPTLNMSPGWIDRAIEEWEHEG